jgi:hypothetical protein
MSETQTGLKAFQDTHRHLLRLLEGLFLDCMGHRVDRKIIFK